MSETLIQLPIMAPDCPEGYKGDCCCNCVNNFELYNNKDRPISQLLKILLENIGFLDTGLCYLSFDLFLLKKVNESEMKILRGYIDDNNPYCTHEYMFIRGMKEPRIRWLKEQIEKLENEN